MSVRDKKFPLPDLRANPISRVGNAHITLSIVDKALFYVGHVLLVCDGGLCSCRRGFNRSLFS